MGRFQSLSNRYLSLDHTQNKTKQNKTKQKKKQTTAVPNDFIVIISLYLENPVYLYYATSYLLTAFNGSAFSSAKDIKKILDRARTNEVDDDLAQQSHV